MLNGLAKKVRIWMAMGFIALYGACIVAPAAALAFNGLSCLTEHTRSKAPSHVGEVAHDHGEMHHHPGDTDSPDDDGSASSKCCGMISCSGLTPEWALSMVPAVLAGRTSFAAMRNVTGLPPDKLIRPPKSLS